MTWATGQLEVCASYSLHIAARPLAMLAHLGLPLVLLATSTRAAQHILLAAAQGGELTSLVFDDAARTLAKGSGLANAGGQATAISPDAKWAIVVGAGTAQAGSVAAYSIAANGVIAESGKSVGSGGINAVSVAVRALRLALALHVMLTCRTVLE